MARARRKWFCVVSWNKRRDRADSFYMCSQNRNDANRLKHRMDERGMPYLRVVERSSRPRGVEPIKAAMARWGLKPSPKMIKLGDPKSFRQATALARQLRKAGTSAASAMPRVAARFDLTKAEARSIRRSVWGR